MTPSPQEVSQLLLAWRNGDEAALTKLIPLIYNELRRLAHQYMRRERAGHTLQTTALVSEAYLRMVDQRNIEWQNRTHFLAVAARAMRRILVENARSRRAAKRGANARQITLNESAVLSAKPSEELLALDEALNSLALIDQRKSQVVELRYFGGLSAQETAKALGVSEITVKRDWLMAKTWLRRELNRRRER